MYVIFISFCAWSVMPWKNNCTWCHRRVPIIALACHTGTVVTLSVIKCTANFLVMTHYCSVLYVMWIKHHSWRQLFCTHLLTLKICVATIAICFLGHTVEMPPVLAAALASSCSTRCTVPGKHQLLSPLRLGGGVIGQPKLYRSDRRHSCSNKSIQRAQTPPRPKSDPVSESWFPD